MNDINVLVIFKCDNGYKCVCCQTEWVEYETYSVDPRNINTFYNNLLEETKEMYKKNDKWGRYDIEKAFIISGEVS